MSIRQNLINLIEPSIDKYGLAMIVEILGDIAELKSQHIEENWQDKPLARLWQSDAKKLFSVADKLHNK